MHNQRITMLLLLIACCITMTSCSTDYPNQPYTGRHLSIGVIGVPPYIEESDKVAFVSIDFEDTVRKTSDRYDAVWIMNERLAEAASSEYSKVYSQLGLPVVFIGANSLTPFLSAEIDFRPHAYERGTSYAIGIANGLQHGWGLYNDEVSEETIQLFYAELLRFIEQTD